MLCTCMKKKISHQKLLFFYVLRTQTYSLKYDEVWKEKKWGPRSLTIFFQKLIWVSRSRDTSILNVTAHMKHPV